MTDGEFETRLADDAKRMERIEARLTLLEHESVVHGKGIEEIKVSLEANTAKTEEVLKIVTLGKAWFTLGGALASALKWIGAMAIAVAAVIGLIKGGRGP